MKKNTWINWSLKEKYSHFWGIKYAFNGCTPGANTYITFIFLKHCQKTFMELSDINGLSSQAALLSGRVAGGGGWGGDGPL